MEVRSYRLIYSYPDGKGVDIFTHMLDKINLNIIVKMKLIPNLTFLHAY